MSATSVEKKKRSFLTLAPGDRFEVSNNIRVGFFVRLVGNGFEGVGGEIDGFNLLDVALLAATRAEFLVDI